MGIEGDHGRWRLHESPQRNRLDGRLTASVAVALLVGPVESLDPILGGDPKLEGLSPVARVHQPGHSEAVGGVPFAEERLRPLGHEAVECLGDLLVRVGPRGDQYRAGRFSGDRRHQNPIRRQESRLRRDDRV